jgi:hypothetical protein
MVLLHKKELVHFSDPTDIFNNHPLAQRGNVSAPAHIVGINLLSRKSNVHTCPLTSD